MRQLLEKLWAKRRSRGPTEAELREYKARLLAHFAEQECNRPPPGDPNLGAWRIGDKGTFYWTHPTMGRLGTPAHVIQVWPLVIQLPGIQVMCLSSGECIVPGFMRGDAWFRP